MACLSRGFREHLTYRWIDPGRGRREPRPPIPTKANTHGHHPDAALQRARGFPKPGQPGPISCQPRRVSRCALEPVRRSALRERSSQRSRDHAIVSLHARRYTAARSALHIFTVSLVLSQVGAG